MPDITPENYELLLNRLESLENKISGLEAANKDLAAMNQALIGRTQDTPTAPDVDKKALGDKLMKGLKH